MNDKNEDNKSDILNINDSGSMNSDKINKISNNKIMSKQILTIGGIIFISIVVLIIIIVLLSISSKNDKEEKVKNVIGQIICLFNVQHQNQKVKILGEEFKKTSDFTLYIDEQKINQNLKEYIFNRAGDHKIKIDLHESINMDYMFKDITSLINIEMYSKNEVKLLSMKSTFEGCISLISVNISGFNLLSS
jgi:predicted nucleic-acid-binding protein